MEVLSKRKPTRLKGYDYSMPGAYFVTVYTKNKKCRLGKIAGDGDFDVPKMNLSKSILSACEESGMNVIIEENVEI